MGVKWRCTLGVVLQEGLNLGCFVRRQVVQDDVDLLFGWAGIHHLAEKLHKLLTGVMCGGLALDLTGFNVQRGIQRKRGVTIVFRKPWRSIRPGDIGNTGSSRSRAWMADFSSHAEDGGMLQGIHIQANDVGRLALEIRIIASHVALQPGEVLGPLCAKSAVRCLC